MGKRIVVKFGGSNLKEKEDILRIVKITMTYKCPLVIVVSALYGITDKLYQILHHSLSNKEKIKEFSETVFTLKKSIIDHLIDSNEIKKLVSGKIMERLKELEKYLKGIHYIGEIPSSVEDTVLSYGERLSALLITEILNYYGVNCEEKYPEDIGLVTDGEFGNASVNYEISKKNLEKNLLPEKSYIIPGFYGVSSSGKVTIFGRGGSDYSAAVIAGCLNARYLDIWKDVAGFRTADPGVVNNTAVLKALSYSEAAELAYFGAKILHPRTVEPLRENNIKIRVLNIDNFSNSIIPDSVIGGKSIVLSNVIKSVTFTNDISILKVSGSGVGIKSGIVSHITTALDNASINIKSIITSQTSINFLLSNKDLDISFNILKDLDLTVLKDLQKLSSISLIAVVGEGLLKMHGILSRVLSAVSESKINVLIFSLGASDVAAYFIVEEKDVLKGVKAIHSEFFNKKGKDE